jgi:hypothetical protein
MRQEFICERCGLESNVELAADESVYAACEAIRADHEKWSPECTGDLSTIRLVPKNETFTPQVSLPSTG